MDLAIQGTGGYSAQTHFRPQDPVNGRFVAGEGDHILEPVGVLPAQGNGSHIYFIFQQLHIRRRFSLCRVAAHILCRFCIKQLLCLDLQHNNCLHAQFPGVDHLCVQVLKLPGDTDVILILQPGDIDIFLKGDQTAQGLKPPFLFPVQHVEIKLSTDNGPLILDLHRLQLQLPGIQDHLCHVIHGVRHNEIIIQGDLCLHPVLPPVHMYILLHQLQHKSTHLNFLFSGS